MRDHLGNWRSDWAGDLPPDPYLDKPALYRMRNYAVSHGAISLKADRDLWDALTVTYPMIKAVVEQTLAFSFRAVEHFTAAGIDQIVEIGSWSPTDWPTHELAPNAKVVYAADDPVLVAYGRHTLRDQPNAIMIHGDPSDPGTILDGGAAEFLDLAEPVLVLLPGVLDLMGELDAPGSVVARIPTYLAPGSWVAATHLTAPALEDDRDAQAQLCRLWRALGDGLHPRPRPS